MKLSLRFTPKKYQHGAALLFSLIFLLLLTIIGMTAMQSSTLQERMAGNIRDANLAFQAAEMSLRAGEADLATTHAFGGTTGPYRKQVTNATSAATWLAMTWNNSTSTQIATVLTDTGISATNNPRYVVEEISAYGYEAVNGSAIDFASRPGDAPIIYRITSKGLGMTGNSPVILQSTYRNN